ncbi:MAG TPA: hypothetical protein VME22_07280 [Solirubrobacteraceae bacterium]|nr:hypothetical protein [Solirubrobacteraceae bacterium]
MQPEERLAYESRVRTRQVALAGAAGVLVMLAVLVQLPGPHVKVNEETLGLITEHKRIAQDIAGSVISALGSLALGWTLWWLFEAARARDPRVRPAFMGPVAFVAGAITAVAAIGTAIASAHAASEFVSHGNQTWVEAHALVSKAWFVIPEVAGYLGAFMVAISLVLVSLAAMRVGLLPRFMGYLGIIAGVLTILPFLPIPIVEAYWLLALAYLMSGRWPSGVPPAWTTGEAVPWPARQSRDRSQPASRAPRGRTPKPVPQPAGAPAAGSTRATTPKRKRKRRK